MADYLLLHLLQYKCATQQKLNYNNAARFKTIQLQTLLIFGTMKYLRRFFQYLYCIYALITFVIIMFIVLPFVVLSSFFGVKGGNIVYLFCNIWARVWYACIFIRHKEIYEADHDRSKQFIFVANHCSYMDIPALVRCMHQPVRVLGKHEMVRYPVFGWIYRAAVIIVDRSSLEKRAKSIVIKSLLTINKYSFYICSWTRIDYFGVIYFFKSFSYSYYSNLSNKIQFFQTGHCRT